MVFWAPDRKSGDIKGLESMNIMILQLLVLSTFTLSSAYNLHQVWSNKIDNKVRLFQLQSSKNIDGKSDNNNRIIKKILLSPITLLTSSLRLATDTVYTVSDIVTETPTATTQVNTNINTFINNIQNIKLPEIKNEQVNLTETELLILKSKQQAELKNKYKKFLPQTYITILLLNIRSLIDRYYEYQDIQEQKSSSNTNINTNNKQPKLIQSLSYSTDTTKSKKGGSILDKYEEIKESYYSSTDTLSNILTTLIKTKDSTIQTISNTANTITNLPQRTTQTIEATKSNIQDSITQSKQYIQTLNENLQTTGQIIYKIITLEAAEETYTRIQTNMQSIQTKYTPLTSPPPPPPPHVVPETTKISAKSAQKPENQVDKIKSVYSSASKVASVTFGVTSSLVSGVRKVVSWALSKRSDRRSSSSTQQPATATGERMSVVLKKQESAPIYTTTTTAGTADLASVTQDSIVTTTQAVNKAEGEVEPAEVPTAPTFLWDTLTAATTVADTGSDASKAEEMVVSSDSSTTTTASVTGAGENDGAKAVEADD